MSFLCDTNIISELARPIPNPGVITWSQSISSIFLSAITLEEICYGLSAKPNQRIQTWFDNFLVTYCQVIPISPEIAKRAGELRGYLQTQGKPRTQADIIIAATAEIHQITLITRNTKDFEGCGITILNPFT
ncbi:MAG: type II toxin-antitoxin system VapC family toxin [Nostoc sp. EfeVER01]|uniref:type II toxin-antitoxin system VapC family toxin n=1 Tax=unclassified Nostoc TaxID=2593658 RepID=UPI002AD2EE55|nr:MULTISPECIES: type II toxin-antitoxin system VapC family toxin [unclassified Nostoc]MDZ7947202.1 type II toxin-antitoxin system VapC family toxin [Nostoc sp. EfeVER01]MDZ7994655.1 type II toxin-antitoxin system VapC family toxin [Nostoc sp. EspVER01]